MVSLLHCSLAHTKMVRTVLLLISLCLTIVALPSSIEANEAKAPLNITEKSEEQVLATYINRFKQKRIQQLATTEEILEKSEYEYRYKLAKALVDEMFKTLRKAQKVIVTVDLSQHPAIPLKNDTLLNALLATFENTAFLSDLVLRLPDMLHLQIDNHAVRTEVIKWALETCIVSPVFADASLNTPLKLAQQELRLVSPDPNFVNPYRDQDTKRVSKAPPRRSRASRGPRFSDL
jgi:hypothetical protein